MAFKKRRKSQASRDWYKSAKGLHACISCLHSQPATFETCPKCSTPGMRVYFPSSAEHARGAALVRMSAEGKISHLRFHPKYDLTVDGIKVTSYTADAEYRRDGKLIVEDVKAGSSDFIDNAAKLKIGLFNALHAKHGVAVNIYRSE